MARSRPSSRHRAARSAAEPSTVYSCSGASDSPWPRRSTATTRLVVAKWAIWGSKFVRLPAHPWTNSSGEEPKHLDLAGSETGGTGLRGGAGGGGGRCRPCRPAPHADVLEGARRGGGGVGVGPHDRVVVGDEGSHAARAGGVGSAPSLGE